MMVICLESNKQSESKQRPSHSKVNPFWIHYSCHVHISKRTRIFHAVLQKNQSFKCFLENKAVCNQKGSFKGPFVGVMSNKAITDSRTLAPDQGDMVLTTAGFRNQLESCLTWNHRSSWFPSTGFWPNNIQQRLSPHPAPGLAQRRTNQGST